MISVQTEEFDLALEYKQLRQRSGDAGAIVTFTGLVRELYEAGSDAVDNKIRELTLEHYPGMTEKCLQDIVDEAHSRWSLLATRIIHRVGPMRPGEEIVMVGTASSHRQDAFEAAQFLMDYLKSRAPFWKKQDTGHGSHWVEARESDADAVDRWQVDSKVS